MAIFDRFKRADFRVLQEFAEQHEGVEGYLEPKTTTKSESLLMVDRLGNWARAAIADRGQALAFCKKLGIPHYDAAIVGYPKSLNLKGAPGYPAEVPTANELEQWFAQGEVASGEDKASDPES